MKIRAHESFYLRKGWLQKGAKNIIKNNRIFNDKDSNACDVLGIGVNMVKSLKYWLIATGVAVERTEMNKKVMRLTDLGELINIYDKFYEEIGTNMIIHYKLATNADDATAWYWLFNEYDANVIDKEQFVHEFGQYVKYNKKENETVVESEKIYSDEFNCIIKTYISSDKEDDPEETKICPLSELGLLSLDDVKKKEYRKTSPILDDIHPLVAYAIICDMFSGKRQIKISEICNEKCSFGKVFNMSRTSVILVLDKIAKLGYIKLNRTAGLDVINIIHPMTFLEALEMYYKSLNGEI